MLRRKMWLILVVTFLFLFDSGLVIAADKGTCSCKPVFGNGNWKPVTSYAVTNSCRDGYEPEWGMDLGGYSGCNCTCKSVGTAKSMKVDVPVTGAVNYQSTSANPFCSDGKSISTALGCVPVDMKDFVPWLLNVLFGIAGGIAFLLMVYGFILIATSSGDEKKVAGAKETITSAIVGLLVCIFSIFILRLIAVNILQIPGIN